MFLSSVVKEVLCLSTQGSFSALSSIFSVFVVAMPVAQTSLVLLVWFTPLTPRIQRVFARLVEAIGDLSGFEVMIVAALVIGSQVQWTWFL